MKVYLFLLNFASILFRDFQGFLDFASIKCCDFSQIAKIEKFNTREMTVSENKVFENEEMIVAVNAIQYAIA